MPKSAAAFVFSLAVLINLGHVICQTSVGQVFLLGGAMSDDNSEVYNALRDATGKQNPKIVVAISAAPSLSDGLDAYFVDYPDSWSYETLFTFYGFQANVLHLAVDNYQEGSSSQTLLGRENIQKVMEADVIFFNGGDQSRHSRAWFHSNGSDSDIMAALRLRLLSSSPPVVSGTSAGAAIMSNPTYGEGYSYGYYFYGGDLKPCVVGESMRDDREGTDSFRYDENGGSIQGFGFIQGALVDTHFDARGRFGRLPTALKSVGLFYGFGVGENMALFVNRSAATAYGNDGVWFVDTSFAVFGEGTQFNATNITISYLTSGDSIDLETKEVTSSKPLITSFQGPGYNSGKVFNGREGIAVIKSLSSSVSSSSVGHSEEKIPTAQVRFYKARAYVDQNRNLYTVDKMRMDIGTVEFNM